MIISMSTRTKNVIFGALYAVLVLFAICPPLYLWGSGNATLFLGVPFAVWYWILDFVLLLAVMFGYYAVEQMRGEVDSEGAADAAQAKGE
jgi:hypothetical protein